MLPECRRQPSLRFHTSLVEGSFRAACPASCPCPPQGSHTHPPRLAASLDDPSRQNSPIHGTHPLRTTDDQSPRRRETSSWTWHEAFAAPDRSTRRADSMSHGTIFTRGRRRCRRPSGRAGAPCPRAGGWTSTSTTCTPSTAHPGNTVSRRPCARWRTPTAVLRRGGRRVRVPHRHQRRRPHQHLVRLHVRRRRVDVTVRTGHRSQRRGRPGTTARIGRRRRRRGHHPQRRHQAVRRSALRPVLLRPLRVPGHVEAGATTARHGPDRLLRRPQHPGHRARGAGLRWPVVTRSGCGPGPAWPAASRSTGWAGPPSTPCSTAPARSWLSEHRQEPVQRRPARR